MIDILWILAPVLYMVIGVGAARALAKLADREISLLDVCFWPISLIIFAICGETT
jgi:hypothetical protein